jgi:hypothetical protein
MQAKLTLRPEEQLIDNGKKFTKQLVQIVAHYFTMPLSQQSHQNTFINFR